MPRPFLFVVAVLSVFTLTATSATGAPPKQNYIAIVSDSELTTIVSPSGTAFRLVRSIAESAQTFDGFSSGHQIAMLVAEENGFESEADVILLARQTGPLVEIAFTGPYPYALLTLVADAFTSTDPDIEISLVRISDLAEVPSDVNGGRYKWLDLSHSNAAASQ